MTSYKHLFSRALAAAPGRLHFAAHSHHLWPDATRDAHLAAWDDAARLADHKWDKVFGEIWPQAQANAARALNLPSPDTIVFAPNTHELVFRMISAMPARPVRILTTDEEFHSFRRQSARLVESGAATLDIVRVEPFADFAERFLAAAAGGAHDLVYVSHVFFKSGRVFDRAFELARLARPEGPWIAVDGYHGFMAIPTDLAAVAGRLFYIAGGYKYAMAGEGAAFMHAPPGFGPRPVHSGWFAEFGELTGPPGGVGYTADAGRFMGATFDPSGLARFNAVFAMLVREGIDANAALAHVAPLQEKFLDAVAAGRCGRLAEATLLAPRERTPRARFLAFRHKDAGRWCAALDEAGVVTDFRDDVLRIGFALYHDAEDVERLCAVAARVLT
ncbi:MAG: aminotransferase class V-fold PLP-dependent enzyme [Pseudomonadota bacterium]|nr:aminotransferase class V-fold PLP-dependent enzyme [Pseudomonadota bacterium]